MIDPQSIATLIAAGATVLGPKVGEVAGTEIIKEMTKDAYKSFKKKLADICGRGASRALEQVEADPASEDARKKLASAVSHIDAEDAAEIDESYETLVTALKDDPAARKTAEVMASIKLDVESDGKVTIQSIRGARTIDVKARSTDDFTFSHVDMDGGPSKGN